MLWTCLLLVIITLIFTCSHKKERIKLYGTWTVAINNTLTIMYAHCGVHTRWLTPFHSLFKPSPFSLAHLHLLQTHTCVHTVAQSQSQNDHFPTFSFSCFYDAQHQSYSLRNSPGRCYYLFGDRTLNQFPNGLTNISWKNETQNCKGMCTI